MCFTLHFTQIRNHHPYNLALRGPLVRVRRLGVNVKRDPAVGVPQELLYGLHIFPVRLKQAVSGSGGAAAAKSTGSQAAATAVKTASGSLPGGGATYCSVDETHVEFHSAQPIPIAAQLLRVFPQGDGWNLLPAIVEFVGSKTKEISH